MRKNKRFWAAALLIASSCLLFFQLLVFIDMWIDYNVPKTGAIGNGPPKMTAMDGMLLGTRALVILAGFVLSLRNFTKTLREDSAEPNASDAANGDRGSS
ncbi:hypothetical protein ACTHPH_01870 [Paenibacillus pasadenensis]|uniref:Uncharacterized protein n=2 Tax=Paenibacillus TaxID=44249 RepID=A0A2N5N8E4_9BACL|nr:hypothetical protein [Paenibacillus pasadenensis]PLT46593.1 hypothetical protein B8V81_0817 [Paenibacillus pasadenensis]